MCLLLKNIMTELLIKRELFVLVVFVVPLQAYLSFWCSSLRGLVGVHVQDLALKWRGPGGRIEERNGR